MKKINKTDLLELKLQYLEEKIKILELEIMVLKGQTISAPPIHPPFIVSDYPTTGTPNPIPYFTISSTGSSSKIGE